VVLAIFVELLVLVLPGQAAYDTVNLTPLPRLATPKAHLK
jgi:hypothetical protein